MISSGPREAGHHVLEELEPFAGQQVIPKCPVPVMLPPGRAMLLTRPAATGSSDHHEDERNCSGGIAGSENAASRPGEDHIRLERDQLSGELGQAGVCSPGKPQRQREIATLDISQVAQPLPQCLDVARRRGR